MAKDILSWKSKAPTGQPERTAAHWPQVDRRVQTNSLEDTFTWEFQDPLARHGTELAQDHLRRKPGAASPGLPPLVVVKTSASFSVEALEGKGTGCWQCSRRHCSGSWGHLHLDPPGCAEGTAQGPGPDGQEATVGGRPSEKTEP